MFVMLILHYFPLFGFAFHFHHLLVILCFYYPRKSEGLCFYRCCFVCLSVCLFITMITK